MYEKQQYLVDEFIEQMKVCADMLGEPDKTKESVYGFVPGLNEQESEERLKVRIKDISQGIFQVMFTGTFNSGKSTVLNALMHSNVLPMGPIPETAVITKIIFGDKDERVVIYKHELDENGQPKTVVMKDIPEFFKEYHVDRKDTEKFRRIVDYVELYQESAGIAGSMVQLVDSPGTRASAADDAVALEFAENVDALVFVTNALAPFDKCDKEYIEKYFANKKKKNIFFVVNKINLLNTEEDVEDVKQYVRDELERVFLGENGEFDEALYQSRVFYVNALGSMNIRLGQKAFQNGKEIISDDETGIPDFEMSLNKFLTSGDRDKMALSAYRGQMANLYLIAEQSIQNQLSSLAKGKDVIEQDLKDFVREKERVMREINDIEDDIDSARRDILRDARDVYSEYLDAIDTEWDEYFSGKSDTMGIHVVKLLGAKLGSVVTFWQDKSDREERLREKSEEATREFADGICGFMDLKKNELAENFKNRMEVHLSTLETKLNNHQENLERLSIPIDVAQIMDMVVREHNINIPVTNENNSKLGQALVAIMFSDPELIVEAAGGRCSNIDFIIDVIKTNVVDVLLAGVLLSLFGNFVGIVFFVLAKIIKTGVRGDSLTEKLIAETKEAILNGSEDEDGNAVDGLKKEGKCKYLADTESAIGGAMLRASHALTTGIRDRLSAIERQLNDAYDRLESNENALASETKRTSQILNRFGMAISRMSELTNDMPLSTEEIKALATCTEIEE